MNILTINTVFIAITKSEPPNSVKGMIWFMVFLYFIPSVVALLRVNRTNASFISIFLLNSLFGWSVIGWWLSMTKALSTDPFFKQKQYDSQKEPSTDHYQKLATLNELRSSGAITDSEFEKEKRRILKKR